MLLNAMHMIIGSQDASMIEQSPKDIAKMQLLQNARIKYASMNQDICPMLVITYDKYLEKTKMWDSWTPS